QRPLASLNVLDFTTLLPGPFATMLLADLGANVLRIDAPHRPDLIREMPPFDDGVSAWHALLNRNKRSLALDLKRPGAAAVVRRLLQRYDVLVEQFRPGVMARLGLDYAALHEDNPRLIYCSITGYGQTGPYRDRAGHDNNYLALSGIMSHTGRQAGGPPGMGIQVADVGGGSFGAIAGVLAAVIQRYATGDGQAIDVSMFDMAVAWNSLAIGVYLVGGALPDYERDPLNGGDYYDYYRTRDGRYLAVGSLEPKFWQGFCQAIERPDLIALPADPAPAVRQALKAAVAETIAGRDLAEWAARFAPLDVCVEPVLNVAETVAHPQTIARRLVVDVPKPDGTAQRQVGCPLKFSASESEYRHIGTAPGAHTEAVLGELGYAPGEIVRLRDQGVLG
ncbi:MAG TPA: CaiB/BaiF CoA-transferase family protein, partial [Roseiflexaceae bacterium]